MKKLLLASSLSLVILGFGCHPKKTQGVVGGALADSLENSSTTISSPDSLGVRDPSAGTIGGGSPVEAGIANTDTSVIRDSIWRIEHGVPDQKAMDSLKSEKTKDKFK